MSHIPLLLLVIYFSSVVCFFYTFFNTDLFFHPSLFSNLPFPNQLFIRILLNMLFKYIPRVTSVLILSSNQSITL